MSSTNSPCEIGSIDPTPRAPKLFEYLKKASSAGTLVIIRISPSPGNFVDWNDPVQSNHHLTTTVPAGGSYCQLPDTWQWGFMKYRAVDDVAREIEQIRARMPGVFEQFMSYYDKTRTGQRDLYF